jgi:adenylate cyclase
VDSGATAAADGTPNITYMSLARFLDEERIAISNQFFGKTTSNLDVNPFLAVRVIEPQTMLEYELDATRLRSERAGELFDLMRVQIDAIADQTGMRGVFRLRSCGSIGASWSRVRSAGRGNPRPGPTPSTG